MLKLYIYRVIAFIIYILVMGIVGYWIYLNNAPLSWDQSGYMVITAQLGWLLKKLQLKQLLHVFIHHEVWNQRPALFMLIGSIVFNIVGPNVKLIVFFSNAFWLAILSISTYKIMVLLSKNQKAACIALFIVLTCPSINILSRDYTVDLPLTAALTLFYLCYLKTNLFAQKSLSFTLSLLFVALIKESFILYIFPLLLITFFYLNYTKLDEAKLRKRNFIISVIIPLSIMILVFSPIFSSMIANIVANIGNEIGRYYSRNISIDNINYYLVYIWIFISSSTGLSFIYSIFILIILLASLKEYKKISFTDNKSSLFILFSIIISLLGLTFITDVDFRFIVPLIPIIVVLLLSVVNWFLNKKFIIIMLVCCIFCGSIQFIGQLFSYNVLERKFSIGYVTLWEIPERVDNALTIGEPKQNYSNRIPEVINFLILSNLIEHKILLIGNSIYFNINIFKSYFALNDKNIQIKDVPFKDDLDLLDYEVIILKTKNIVAGCPFCDENRYQKMVDFVKNGVSTGSFYLIKTYSLNDGDDIQIYIRNTVLDRYKFNKIW